MYSTCSIAAEENEGVVDYILGKRYVKIVETGLPIDKEGLVRYEDKRYDPRLKMTRRVYPHMHNMDGFYIAKLIKFKDGKRPEIDTKTEKKVEVRKISTKGLGKRDRMKLKGKKRPVMKKPEPVEEQPQEDDQEMLKKRKIALREKIALIKKKKQA